MSMLLTASMWSFSLAYGARDSDLVLLQVGAQMVQKEECLPPGRLLFAHVMKDAGESVNHYMQCLCDKKTCSGLQREGPSKSKWGVGRCDPTVCSSHGMVAERGDDCGSDFWKAKMFTVLRDPVDRVFSLYNYYRYNMKESFYVHNSLMDILENIKVCQSNPKCTNPIATGHGGISEGMVGWYFGNAYVNSLLEMSRSTSDAVEKVANRTGEILDPLEHAKSMLQQFSAIFYVDDFDRFPELWGKSGLPLSKEPEPDCEFVKVGASDCGNCKITKNERKLITELNQLDIELFEYSKTLPNALF